MLSIILGAIIVILVIALMRSGATTRASLNERDRAFTALRNRFELMSTQRDILVRILEGLGEGVLAVDHERQVVLANRRFAEMFNVSGDWVGRPLAEVTRVAPLFAAFDAALARHGGVAAIRRRVRRGRAARSRCAPFRCRRPTSPPSRSSSTSRSRAAGGDPPRIRRRLLARGAHAAGRDCAPRSRSFELAGEQMTAEEDQQLRRIMTRQLRAPGAAGRRPRGAEPHRGGRSAAWRGRTSICCAAGRRSLRGLRRARRAEELASTSTATSAHVIADPMRIQQAFANLVDNAIKYGGDANDDRHRRPRPSAIAGVVRITDHGEGIPAEEQERIFRRFYRVDKSRSQEIAGTGLGLAITKHLVLLHNGTIDVESEPGKGRRSSCGCRASRSFCGGTTECQARCADRSRKVRGGDARAARRSNQRSGS